MENTKLQIKHLDLPTIEHSIRVSILVVQFGIFLNLPPSDLIDLHLGGLLHDLGKFCLSEEFFIKSEISTSEFDLIKQHPTLGLLLLSSLASTHGFNVSDTVIDIVVQHHEKENGSGYPDGLTGDRINELAKIVAICDIFDALSSKRSYKDAYSFQKAIDILESESKKQHISPFWVDQFIQFLNSRK